MKKAFAIILSSLMILLPTQAQAEGMVCEVRLSGRLAVDSGGRVYIDMVGARIVSICTLGETNAGGTTKDSCAAWYSSLLTYKTAKARVQFYFNFDNPLNAGVTSCATLGDWVDRSPYFLESIQ